MKKNQIRSDKMRFESNQSIQKNIPPIKYVNSDNRKLILVVSTVRRTISYFKFVTIILFKFFTYVFIFL